MSTELITVYGKDDLGYSPKFGPIVKGQEYSIHESDFSDVLFVRSPSKQKAPDKPVETGGTP